MNSKTLTLRMTRDVYERATALAERRKQSLNRLFHDGLVLLDRQERERALFDDFSAIGAAGTTETDVEFALLAQVQATDTP
jgi:hypothetical protein